MHSTRHSLCLNASETSLLRTIFTSLMRSTMEQTWVLELPRKGGLQCLACSSAAMKAALISNFVWRFRSSEQDPKRQTPAEDAAAKPLFTLVSGPL